MIKNRTMKRSLYLFLGLFFILPTIAQEVQDTIKIKAKRLNEYPANPPKKVKKHPIEYSTSTLLPSQWKRKEQLFSLAPKDEKTITHPNFVSLGAGTNTNVEGQLLLRKKVNPKSSWQLSLLNDIRQPKVTIHQKEVSLNKATTSGQFSYLRHEKKINWNVKADVRLDCADFITSLKEETPTTHRQSTYLFRLKGQLSSTDKNLPLQFKGEAKYQAVGVDDILGYQGFYEHQLAAKATFEGKIDENYKVGISGELHRLFYSIEDLDARTSLALTPYLLYQEAAYYLRLGAVVSLNNEDKTTLRFAPDIYASYQWKNNLSVFLSAKGKLKIQDRANLQEQCPYWGAQVFAKNTFERFNIKLGGNWTNQQGLFAEANLGYKNTANDMHLYALSSLTHPLLQVKYATSKALYYGVQVRYSYAGKFQIQTKATGYSWKQSIDDAFFVRKPKCEMYTELTYTPIAALQLTASYQYTQWVAATSDDRSLFNLSANYQIRPNFSVYATLKNAFNASYYDYPYYPTQGTTLLGGIQLSF
jgi:hypothetical protein